MARKLENKHRHMIGKSVKVNGRVYEIDAECRTVVDNDEDYRKIMLCVDAWTDVGEVDEEPTVPEDEEPTNPEEGEDTADIPDPDMSMDMDALRSLADRYQIEYAKRTPKAALVSRLKKAMYE